MSKKPKSKRAVQNKLDKKLGKRVEKKIRKSNPEAVMKRARESNRGFRQLPKPEDPTPIINALLSKFFFL